MTDRNKEIVSKIKDIRSRKGITQSEVAKALNITTTAYSRIENSKTQLTVNNLFVIQELLEVSLNELLPLHIGNILNNKDNFVVGQLNNGALNISITAEEIEKLLKK